MDASELARTLAAKFDLAPDAFEIGRTIRIQRPGSLPLQMGFVPDSDLLQVSIPLGGVNELLRAQALVSLMLANGQCSQRGHPHFALAADRCTVVLCRMLCHTGQDAQAVWSDLQTLCGAAQATRQALESNHFINPATYCGE